MLNRRMPNGTYWWCERGIKLPLLDCILILIKHDKMFIIENIKSGECYEEDEM